ncbi:hypothetical protein J4Q44_G00046660 [Coregonus suidteri]|uniref:MADF domain-containing protein n=1 Tax=Coregonus suidteri TaxID=861788 RepID=A0AAN8R6J3_9TELE
MAELEKEGLPQTMQENRDEEEPQYTDDSKPSKIQDDACFEEKLIEEVRRYTNLYNTSLKDYKDFTMTNNSWKEIAQTLRVEEQICRTKWKNLRDRYVRLRRKIKGKSGDAASGIQPQILTTLSWLSGFIKHKETESNYPKAEEMDTPEDLQEDNLIEQEHFHSSNNEKQDGHLAVRRNKLEKHQLENIFKATSSAANVDRVLTQQRTFNKVKESKRQQSKIRARAPGKGTPSHSKTMQEKEEEPLDTDDSDEWIDGFSPGGEKPHYCFDCDGDRKRHEKRHYSGVSDFLNL